MKILLSFEVTKAWVPAIEKVARDPAVTAKLAALGMVQDLPASREALH
jgi:hypothetical protein